MTRRDGRSPDQLRPVTITVGWQQTAYASALVELAWRMLADPRHEWLAGQPGLYGTSELALASSQLDEIAAMLRTLHGERAPPIGQSVRGGTQTAGQLFLRSDREIGLLTDALAIAIRQFVGSLPDADPRHPLLKHRDMGMAFGPSWSAGCRSSSFNRSRRATANTNERRFSDRVEDLLLRIPNPADPDVPVGGGTQVLAAEYGPKGVRVNGISAGPIKTLAAAGIAGFRKMLGRVAEVAPLRRNVTLEDVGNAAAFLCSDLASGITGEILYVDAGFSHVVAGIGALVLGKRRPEQDDDQARGRGSCWPA